jgi:NADH:ubiquinone oxidoreductase subunit
MAKILLNIYSLFFGKLVGRDELGNRYYEGKCSTREFDRKRRWVIYKGYVEASKVTARWFNWLHYQADQIPPSAPKSYEWQKPHLPNMSGTKLAYYPAGHPLSSRKKKEVKSYQSWRP